MKERLFSLHGESELSTLSEVIVESLAYGPRSVIIHTIEALLVLMAAESLPCLISSLLSSSFSHGNNLRDVL